MSDENAIKIAVLEEQFRGLREQQKAHSDASIKRFDEMMASQAAQTASLVKLEAIMNRGKGAFAASMMFAGAIGATALAVISWFLGLFHR